MNIRTRLTLLIIAVAALGLFSQVQATEGLAQKQESDSPQLGLLQVSSAFRGAATGQVANRRNAKPGDIASGSVVNAPGGELHLNIRPCEGETFIVVFHQPYSRSTRGQKNCGGQAVTIEQVQQN